MEDTDQECSTNEEIGNIYVKHRGKIKYATARYNYEGKIIVYLKLIDYIYVKWIELDVIRGSYIVLF